MGAEGWGVVHLEALVAHEAVDLHAVGLGLGFYMQSVKLEYRPHNRLPPSLINPVDLRTW